MTKNHIFPEKNSHKKRENVDPSEEGSRPRRQDPPEEGCRERELNPEEPLGGGLPHASSGNGCHAEAGAHVPTEA